MSVRHPNIAAWQRDHDGSYTAEVGGFALRVAWTPNDREHRGSFHWRATLGAEKPHAHPDHYEELEEAMAAAEDWARLASMQRLSRAAN